MGQNQLTSGCYAAELASTTTVMSTGSQDTCESRCNSKLFDLCQRFSLLERVNRELCDVEVPGFWERVLELQTALAVKICAIQPRTLEDFRAIARALVGWTHDMDGGKMDDLNGCDGQLLSFLWSNLIGMDPLPPRPG